MSSVFNTINSNFRKPLSPGEKFARRAGNIRNYGGVRTMVFLTLHCRWREGITKCHQSQTIWWLKCRIWISREILKARMSFIFGALNSACTHVTLGNLHDNADPVSVRERQNLIWQCVFKLFYVVLCLYTFVCLYFPALREVYLLWTPVHENLHFGCYSISYF